MRDTFIVVGGKISTNVITANNFEHIRRQPHPVCSIFRMIRRKSLRGKSFQPQRTRARVKMEIAK